VNRDGVLLEMVQLLTDLDLVISKSYISSDGGWLMDGKDCCSSRLLSICLPSPVEFDSFSWKVGNGKMHQSLPLPACTHNSIGS